MLWVSPVIQLVTAGGFGALVWYLVLKFIPAIETRHKAERAEHQAERAEWLGYIKQRDESFESLAREHLVSTTELGAGLDQLERKIDDYARNK